MEREREKVSGEIKINEKREIERRKKARERQIEKNKQG